MQKKKMKPKQDAENHSGLRSKSEKWYPTIGGTETIERRLHVEGGLAGYVITWRTSSEKEASQV